MLYTDMQGPAPLMVCVPLTVPEPPPVLLKIIESDVVNPGGALEPAPVTVIWFVAVTIAVTFDVNVVEA